MQPEIPLDRLTAYEIQHCIYESSRTIVYRAIQRADNRPVILKCLCEPYPSLERIAWIKREYNLLSMLDIPGVPQTQTLEAEHNIWCIVMEDIGGTSLKQLHIAGTLSLPTCIHIAQATTSILGLIHRHDIMHKDINPSNIIYNPTNDQIMIIDFSISALLNQEKQLFRNPNVLEGTLAYMSPEQTGRMNRLIDYRTDFYSLGVTFYELLTGQLPFASNDPLEIIHSHIARQPVPPHEINTNIPVALSAIISKLMAKNAEDRYQSAYGLIADLTIVQDMLQQESPRYDDDTNSEQDTIHSINANLRSRSFIPGSHDILDRFSIAQKLYGRDMEIEILLAAFERIRYGPGELMLITGPAGIGKTALVQELHKPITHRRGYFIAGKFDQYNKNKPYSAFVQAFRSLMRYLLTESDSDIARWRQRITQALGSNSPVISDVITELEQIIGTQPPTPPLPPTEAHHRFHLVFQKFVRVFAQQEHPLVLFLDDLQWADSASLELIHLLITDPQSAYILLIGTYRENEVLPSSPLVQTIDAIASSTTTRLRYIRLSSLDMSSVLQLVVETLKCPAVTAQPLADLLIAKTDGNPFFVNEFLTLLYTQHLIMFDYASRTWTWDIDHIHDRQMTTNVVELLIQRIQQIPETTQHLITLAACIGNRFDLDTLAIIAEYSPERIETTLEPTIKAGLITPIERSYIEDNTHATTYNDPANQEYHFAHDRIQQAAYMFIPDNQKQSVHWNIGKILIRHLDATHKTNGSTTIFDCVNHLNRGYTEASSQDERDMLAHLNLRAGREARDTVAYETAFLHFSLGKQVLGSNAWQRNYTLTLDITREAAEAACLIGNYTRVDDLVADILEHATTLLDTLSAYEIDIQASQARYRLMNAVQTALTALELVGIRFSRHPDEADVHRGYQETCTTLGDETIESLIDLPTMTDPTILAAMRILGRATTAAYGTPAIFALIVFKQVILSLVYGNAPESPFGYVAYAIFLCGYVGDIDAGYQFGQLALRLLDKTNNKEFVTRTCMAANFTVRHWKESIRDLLPSFVSTYEIGMETGDPTHACYSLYHLSYMRYQIGTNLETLRNDLDYYTHIMTQLKQTTPLIWNNILHQVILNLIGPSEHVSTLSGTAFDEKHEIELLHAKQDRTSLFSIAFQKLILNYLFGEYDTALDCIQHAETNIHGAISLPYVPVYLMYASLTYLACLHQQHHDHNHDTYLDNVAANQKKLWIWARHSPTNVLHRYYLVEAERCRLAGKDGDAREYYDKAIALTHDHAYLNDEALAQERAGEYYLARGQQHIASFYIRNAHYALLQWGATAKLRSMEQRYPWLTADSPPTSGYRSLEDTTSQSSAHLDFASIIKASQAISDELALDVLLAKLMRIVIENAGAERGLLLLKQGDQWCIQAEGIVDQYDTCVLQSSTIRSEDAPLSIINYVIHTGTSVVIHNATDDEHFMHDPYIQHHHPHAVLCIPMIHQTQLTGLLYLENTITIGAFTATRIEILNLLCSQAAISIENARLYSHMEDLVAARTTDLERTNAILQEEIIERKRAEEMLVKARDELERRVDERTAELAETNRSLQGEIAERMRTEAHLHRAREAAEAANRAKSIFLANMSHELRTPLNAILGFAQLMEREQTLLPRHQDYMRIIARSGEHLLAVINDILEMSKIEAGLTTLDEQSIDMPLLLKNLYDMFALRAQKKNLSLCIETDPDVPHFILADEHKLQQILINLLSNAIKFTAQGSIRLHISTHEQSHLLAPHTSPSLVPYGQSTSTQTPMPDNTEFLHVVRFEVIDTGKGIPTDQIPALFDAFTQISNDQQYQEGTGLGLPISQHYVQAMNGTISVTSEVGKGSTFAFEIPLRQTTQTTKEPQHSSKKVIKLAPGHPDYRILVVEDMWTNRTLMTHLLESVNFQVKVASNGQEGIDTWNAWNPHLIFMDIRMPGMDGYEATRRIKASTEGKATVIIALTAGAFEEERAIVLDAGCDDFIRKPFRDTDIFEAIHKHLGVDYVYEDDPQSCDADNETPEADQSVLRYDDIQNVGPSLDVLPTATMKQLHHAALLGDIDAVMLLIEEISTKHPSIGKTLRNLANSFQFQEIVAMTEPMTESS